MPSVGIRCHELRVNDSTGHWRLICRTDSDAIVIAEVFSKKSQVTPKPVVDVCRKRLKDYDNARK
jgi:phage-related protein